MTIRKLDHLVFEWSLYSDCSCNVFSWVVCIVNDLTLTNDVRDPLGTSLLRMWGRCSCFWRGKAGDDSAFGDISGDEVMGDRGGLAGGKRPRKRLGRLGVLRAGSGWSGPAKATVELDAVVVVVELETRDMGGVGEEDLKKYFKTLN
jgi:hypothetical protein